MPGDGRGRHPPTVAFALTAAASAVLTPTAEAQLTPDRLYYGKDRTIPMTVAVPEGLDGDIQINLYTPGRPDPVETAAATEGGVDLNGLFPSIWSYETPMAQYAQLFVGDEPVGAPVVIQRMVSPDYASLAGRQAVFQSTRMPNRPVTYSGIRAYPDQYVVLETSMGEITIRLRPEEAPNTVFSFRHLVGGGFYTDIIFHRIVEQIPSGNFVIQVGDPTGMGSGGPGYMIDLENSSLPHDFGVVSMARSGDPNSNGSQFFICLSRPGTAFLDGQYTAFGEAIDGAQTIVDISQVEVDGSDRPLNPPTIQSARLIPADPYTGTPPARVTRPDAPGVER